MQRMNKDGDTEMKLKTLLFILTTGALCMAQTLPLQPRPADALTGSAFEQLVRNFSLTDRENEIYAQVLSGNVPDFQRNLIPVTFENTLNSRVYEVTYYVLPDYLAVGSDSDYFLMPMTPVLAQKICNWLGFTMPTRKMVDQIWSQATVQLAPAPIPPSPEMTTIPVMYDHNQMVWSQRQEVIADHPLGELVGGTKKDVVISKTIYGNPPPNRVVIYGWHYQNGTPIQPLYSGHSETYADYSHGIRLVQDSIMINDQPSKITTTLQNDSLHILFSDEGRIPIPWYPLSASSTARPSAWGVLAENANRLRLSIHDDPDVTHYLVHLSANGVDFNQTILLDKSDPVLSGLSSDSIYYIRLQAVGTDTSNFSEVLAGVPGDVKKKILIVNGFDRSTTGNTYDFMRRHAPAVKNYGYTFDSATNEAITYGLLQLNDYDIVDWILGEESTVDQTFSNSEQTLVKDFLDNGGCLFVSGSEIAWDLDHKGSSSDKNFFWNYLKAEYVADAPNNQSSTWYAAEGMAGNIFEGVSNITFDNGNHGTYNVSWPDVIKGKNGGQDALKYSGTASTQVAAVVYQGMFPNGTQNGALVYLGFPFETIYPESKRFEVMNRVLDYFEDLNTLEVDFIRPTTDYFLYPNYPNPFNQTTVIRYRLPQAAEVRVSIYNVRGQEVLTLLNTRQEAGRHALTWDAGNTASGLYICKLDADGTVLYRKITLLK